MKRFTIAASAGLVAVAFAVVAALTAALRARAG